MTDPPEDPPPAGPEAYGAPAVPDGMMLTPQGLIPCDQDEKANGVAIPGAERLLKDTCVDASLLQTYEPPAGNRSAT